MKLMAALGAWLSVHEGVIVFCCVAVTGLVLAILKIAAHRERKNVVMGMLASLYVSAVTCGTGVRDWRPIAGTGADRTQEPAGQASLPYGAAIFIVCLGAVGVRVWT